MFINPFIERRITMSYNCQKRSKTMSQSKFYKVVVSLVLLLVMVNAGGGAACLRKSG